MNAKELKIVKVEIKARAAQAVVSARDELQAWVNDNPTTENLKPGVVKELIALITLAWFKAWCCLNKIAYSAKTVFAIQWDSTYSYVIIKDVPGRNFRLVTHDGKNVNYHYDRDAVPARFNELVDEAMGQAIARGKERMAKRNDLAHIVTPYNFNKAFEENWKRVEFDLMANAAGSVDLNAQAESICARVVAGLTGKA